MNKKNNNNNKNILNGNNDNNKNNRLKIAAINLNSISSIKRRNDLQKFITDNIINIALISESKLNSKHKVRFIGHNIIRTDRSNSTKGGGTAIIINNRINFTTISYPNSIKKQNNRIYSDKNPNKSKENTNYCQYICSTHIQ